MSIQLYEIIRFKDFEHHRFLSEIYAELWVPTETVVICPYTVVPQTARVHGTDFYTKEGVVYTADQVRELREKEDYSWESYNEYAQVYLWEVWENMGDDGHTTFELTGYVFLPEEEGGPEWDWETRKYPRNGMDNWIRKFKKEKDGS